MRGDGGIVQAPLARFDGSSQSAMRKPRKLCSNLLHNFRPDPPAAKGRQQLCNNLLHNLAPRRRPARPAIESVAVTGLVDLNVLGVALAPYPTIDGFTPVHCVPAPLDSSPSLRSAPKRSMRVLFRVRTAPGPVSSAFRPVVGPHRSSVSASASAP